MTEALQKPGRWFCAIPMAYSETGGFWDRDSGLVVQGFRKLGMDSKFVALGQPGQREDVPLILCTLDQMMDPNWWRQWNLEGVILHAWGLPRYEPISRAIKSAGLKLDLFMDSDGLFNPHVWFWRYLQAKYYSEQERTKFFPAGWALLKTLVAMFRSHHARTLGHLEHGDRLLLPSPLAQLRFARSLMAVGRPDLVRRVRFVLEAVGEDMICDPSIRKQPVIIAVGRWQSIQKGAPVLVKVLARVLSERPEYSCRIIGGGDERVRRLVQPLDDGLKSRINILGRVSRQDLVRNYQESQILLCSSYFESFHIASAEALCCGCSLVGDVRISSMPYFCSPGSGTLSCDLSVNNLADALLAEIDTWRRSERDPIQIGATWMARFHPERVAGMYLNLA